jgi:hypothetical protein
MLQEFQLDNTKVDALDLKILLISSGIVYPEEIYEQFLETGRLAHPGNFAACNGIILPGGVAVHLTANDESLFSIGVNGDGYPCLLFKENFVTDISFPKGSRFYEQKTRSGLPFGQCAVLQGNGILSFYYLWPCQFARNGQACAFCLQALGEMAGLTFPTPTPEDAGEIVSWAIADGCVGDVQLTGGSRYTDEGECADVAAFIRGIDQVAGLSNIPGEIYPYLSAPKKPEAIDEVFDAGADRVAIDLNVWDTDIHSRVCPGHAGHIGRKAQLEALNYVARKYGPNKACSAFVVGIEPVESLMEGAEYLGSRGIVPLLSVWLPGTNSVNGLSQPPGLDYYRQVRQGFAEIFQRYCLVPPGVKAGAHVCMCRDVYDHIHELVR